MTKPLKLPPHKEINISTWIRKGSYNHFIKFSNACYSVTSKIDITEVYNYSKKTKTSVFINMLYLVVKALNEVENFRLRYVNKKVILYEVIHPAFIVMRENGHFENCSCHYLKDYEEFYNVASKAIEDIKKGKNLKSFGNDSPLFNEFYITCLPWIEIVGMTQPTPDKDISNQCVPRICWDKFHIDSKSKKITTNFNINVSHVLIDGRHLSDGFLSIQEKFDNYKKYLK